MHYTIYKTTNKINGKYYIGKHQTTDLNDGYLGSGKLLKRAIRKYGTENFTKEILHVFESEEEMNSKEKELVVVSGETYNLCEGGKGGFGFINSNRLQIANLKNDGSCEHKKRCAKGGSIQKGKPKIWQRGKIFFDFSGKMHSSDTKRKISVSNKGKGIGRNNSQHGTFWITNGTENKKSKGDIPDGWFKGRKV